MVGPFGGIIAATMLNAALTHPSRLGDPVALTVNYAGPIADGGPHRRVAMRTNRSTQHWSITMMQGSEWRLGEAVFKRGRPTSTESGFRVVSGECQRRGFRFPPWLDNYVRFRPGARPDRPRPSTNLTRSCGVDSRRSAASAYPCRWAIRRVSRAS
jgi:hypothetical protein